MFIKSYVCNESTWEALKAAADAGTLDNILSSGDQIPVTLKNGEEIVLDVAHDETGKLFFVIHDCLNETHEMNERATTAGGWAKTEMRRYLNSDILALFPDEIQAVIKPTTIVQIVDGDRVECEDKLFCLSRTQVFGKGYTSSREPEDTQLDIFKRERDRVKECGDNGTWFWWLRSASNYGTFNFVGSSGTYNGNFAHNSYGVVLGFCI